MAEQIVAAIGLLFIVMLGLSRSNQPPPASVVVMAAPPEDTRSDIGAVFVTVMLVIAFLATIFAR